MNRASASTRQPRWGTLAVARATALTSIWAVAACGGSDVPSVVDADANRSWIAGDHHIHSQFSVGWDTEVDPPTPILGGDAVYPIPTNAEMAREHGLSWMVATDHGGPNHSRVNLEMAYPELLSSRDSVPEVIQFYGMEFDTPGADHSSLIIPHSHDEAERLREIESGWAKHDAWPRDSLRDAEPKMIEALEHMREMELPPVLIANHPSRSASDLGEYGLDHPAEFRAWNNTAPEVAVGMAAAPGHQAMTINEDGSLNPERPRGAYSGFPTMGGFDQMTARLGGFWDSMLGEGRRWWVTANSDSHVNWRDGGVDFWPGEYSKTYVLAEQNHDDILSGIRNGRVFVTTGDLISELFVTAAAGVNRASIGGELIRPASSDITVTIRVHDPDGTNSHGDNPAVARVDLIVGDVTGTLDDPSHDTNSTTRVVERFTADDWERDGDYLVMTRVLGDLDGNHYLRVRGTNTQALEPEPDPRGEDPWTDLWFYSNPIFLTVG